MESLRFSMPEVSEKNRVAETINELSQVISGIEHIMVHPIEVIATHILGEEKLHFFKPIFPPGEREGTLTVAPHSLLERVHTVFSLSGNKKDQGLHMLQRNLAVFGFPSTQRVAER
jgi:hypothetical protein